MRHQWMFIACDVKRRKIRVTGGMTTALRSIAEDAAKEKAPKGSKAVAIKAGPRSREEIATFLTTCGVDQESIAPLIQHLGRQVSGAIT